MPKLLSVLVVFVLPDGDDRDSDTSVQLVVRDAAGKVIAQDLNIAPGTRFKDPGTYGPYQLGDHVDQTAQPTDFEGGTSQVIIIPNGHDRVIWNIVVSAHWDDGSGRASNSQLMILDQDVNSSRWANAAGVELLSKVKALNPTGGRDR